MIFQDFVSSMELQKEQLDKKMFDVKSRLHEKNFAFSETKSNSKSVKGVSCLEYSISKEGLAPDPKHVEKVKKCKKKQLKTKGWKHLLG